MMRLFFDVDGVLLNFERAFVQWLNDHHGLDLPEDYETTSWYFEEVMSEADCKQAWHHFMGSDDAARMQPYVDSAHFNTLTANRAVHLLTNFPHSSWDKRVQNLQTVGFIYDSVHHCGFSSLDSAETPSKSEVITRLLQRGEAGLFVDDHPQNCVDVVRNCPQVEVWLMSRRFNQGFDHPQIQRARDWSSVTGRIGNGARQ